MVVQGSENMIDEAEAGPHLPQLLIKSISPIDELANYIDIVFGVSFT